MSYFAHPDAVKSVKMSPKRAPKGMIRDAEDYRRQFPDGRIGSNPGRASIEAGEKLYETALKHIQANYEEFVRAD